MVILGHNLGNSQVSVYRTIGTTLSLKSDKDSVGFIGHAYLFIVTECLIFARHIFLVPDSNCRHCKNECILSSSASIFIFSMFVNFVIIWNFYPCVSSE